MDSIWSAVDSWHLEAAPVGADPRAAFSKLLRGRVCDDAAAVVFASHRSDLVTLPTLCIASGEPLVALDEYQERMLRPLVDPALTEWVSGHQEGVLGVASLTLQPRGKTVVPASGSLWRLAEPTAISPVSLLSTASFCKVRCVELPSGVLTTAIADVKDCFHQIRTPRWSQRYFCFALFRAFELGDRSSTSYAAQIHTMVHPCWAVLLMEPPLRPVA